MNKESWIDPVLSPGKYITWIYTPWISFVKEFSFSIYGPELTHI